MGGVVHRPLVLSSLGRCEDPEGWHRAPLAAGRWRKVAEAARANVRAPICAGSDAEKPTETWRPALADLELVKAYASDRGEGLAMVRARPPARACDLVEDPSPFAVRLVHVSPAGEISLVGIGMAVVDAGDYDGDGRSEVIVKEQRHDRDGYVLFTDGFRGRVAFGWTYH